MNVNVWLYVFSLHLNLKKGSCTQLFSSEFYRNFKKTFILEHFWASACDFIFNFTFVQSPESNTCVQSPGILVCQNLL